jgi:hypothetical protein
MMNDNICESPKRESEINRAFNDLESSIEKLGMIVTSFDSKLINVVRGCIPKNIGNDNEKIQPYSAKLAQDIDRQVSNINEFIERLIDLQDRIEL